MKALPAAYTWLKNEPAPKILIEALALFGTIETPGAGNNPAIMGWVKEVGPQVGINYGFDLIPWCGLFVGVAAVRAGYVPPDICTRASEWAKFGTKSDRPSLGDILVFKREGGGHVGLYVGEDAEAFHVLGGNQADAVTITRILKSRLVAARRSPWKIGQPQNVRPITLAATGAISKNEA